ncbi:MAG: hypothetical protein DI551_06335 [Micavibrio aeruginosavorus]|uniref:DUF4442 domain-containing protein n=1 Tax=Micavibrio aeruginosavorus TaxID=349221 RepID=A0A2W5Q3B8_9BACT|nr:MAG: hypothetical protein DI551_06335 [Micavibrio aeruginosavorus]
MPFDPFSSIASLEKKNPKLGHWVAMTFLSFLSPFNAHLGGKMLEWSDNRCVIAVKRKRGVRNHVGSIHAGALFTLGETCAGLIIIRNFPFGKFRPLMSDVSVDYAKQARGDVTGECVILPETIKAMMETINAGEVPRVEVVTEIYDKDRLLIATATTVWQVKKWDLVKSQKL